MALVGTICERGGGEIQEFLRGTEQGTNACSLANHGKGEGRGCCLDDRILEHVEGWRATLVTQLPWRGTMPREGEGDR